MHKVVLQFVGQAKPLETHYEMSNTHGVACRAQSLQNILKVYVSAENIQ